MPENNHTWYRSSRSRVLVDNNILTDRYFTGEPGLSFLLETTGKKILFDTGSSGLFLANAEKMEISLRDLDYVVLSHGHLDHSGGLFVLVRRLTEAKIGGMAHRLPELVAHSCCFFPKANLPLQNNGSILSEGEVQRQFPVKLSDKPVWITKRTRYSPVESPGIMNPGRLARGNGRTSFRMEERNGTSFRTTQPLHSGQVPGLSSSRAARTRGSSLLRSMRGKSAAKRG